MVTDASVNYTTQESQSIFTNGDAAFMRDWNFVYALLASPETSKVKPNQVGISTIPVSEAGKESFSGLGGWNILVNAALKGSTPVNQALQDTQGELQNIVNQA